MRRRGLVHWRNAHQAGNRQTILFPARGNEGVGVIRSDTRLLRLLAGIELDEQFRTALLGIDLLG
jgi:hypothetical protein